MNEVKSPRRPLMWFYGITLAIIILFNLVFRPMVTEAQIKTVDYGTFMTMTEEEMLDLLATDGMLVKRPILVSEDLVLVGFKETEWLSKVK